MGTTTIRDARSKGGLDLDQVHAGDCLDLLPRLADGSVDLAFADPPFNIGYQYDVYRDRQERKAYLDWSRAWMAEVHRTLKDSGTFWLAIGDEYAAELKLIAQDELGFHCRSWVIWYYTFGVNCVRAFTRSHTHLLHFVKDPHEFTFNAGNPAVRVLSARQLVYADGRANPQGRLPDNTWIYRPQDAPTAFAPDHDIWYFSRVAGTFAEREGYHGCQMPEQLLARIIRVSSRPGELVLDPFAGSGTTLVAAKKLARRFVGCELSANYARRVKQRLDGVHVGDPLEGPADPRTSAPNTKRGRSNVRVRNGQPVPMMDETTRQGLLAAFRRFQHHGSSDLLLCDPDVNAEFVAACKEQGLKGSPYYWNRLLLRIRKAGQLPKSSERADGPARRRIRRSFREMDAYSFASEVAMRLMEIDYGKRIDEILCSPEHATEFDRLAAEYAPGYASVDYRWAALAIRKRARAARSLAQTAFRDWQQPSSKQLPEPIELDQACSDEWTAPGVYILESGGEPVYVGEAGDLRLRIETAHQRESWRQLGVDHVRGLPSARYLADRPDARHGLQSALAQAMRTPLNTALLISK